MRNIELSLWITRKDIAFFTKNFSVMLGAGLTVVEALAVSEDQSRGPLKRRLHDMRSFVEQGNTLADAFSRHRRQFSPVFVDVIRNGELSGTLARNMQQLAERLSDDLELRRKVQGATIYPMIIVAGLIALGTVLSVFVMPRFVRLFSSLDIPLPYMTQVTLKLATFFSNYWWWLMLGLVITVVLLQLSLRIHAVHLFWHRIMLHVPVVNTIVQAVNLARFSGTLGALLASGVPISEALHSVVHSCSNLAYQDVVQRALRKVEQGDSLANVISKQPRLFPSLVVRMIAVGERTGQLSEILQYLGRYYDGEVDSSTKQLGVLIEPVLLVLIGLAVVAVGLAVITPIYEFTASVGAL